MGQCSARLDDGRMCRRTAKRISGLCGTCHGITSEFRRCTQPVAQNKYWAKYCGRPHKTLEEIEEHLASRSSRGRKKPRSYPANSGGTSHRPTQRSYETFRNAHGAGESPRGPSGRRPPTRPVPKRELSSVAKREAAKLCADAILSQGVLAAFEAQITDLVGEKLVDELAKGWDGKHCEDIAKLARGLLAVKGYFYRVLRIILNWLMLKLGYGEVTRLFACQLVCVVPVVWYAKVVAAARVLQITGICMCVMNDRSLTECRCLHDLVLFEGKEAITRLMEAAIHNWREIARRVPEIQMVA
jgi:hypothetical protein